MHKQLREITKNFQKKLTYALTNADNYSIMENMRKSKYMIKMINIWAYGGQVPSDVSAPRWNAICKFIQKNFDDLKIAP
tara:strand:- start:229 stop:465 length:237 start_codon:yes stop_codon:yes gene_type:complete